MARNADREQPGPLVNLSPIPNSPTGLAILGLSC